MLRASGVLVFFLFFAAGARCMEEHATFLTDGHSVGVEVFEPAAAGSHPAVVYLHGADGVSAHEAAYHDSARGLAARGYAVFLIHYFDRTGTRWADGQTILSNFLVWVQTAADAITFATSWPRVDAGRIGVLGASLGAALGLSLASQDERVGVVDELYGVMPDLAAALMRRMPPVLILHGDADLMVPVAEAYKLERLLQGKSIPYEATIYPGQGHMFSGDAARDAMRRVLQFFDRYLGVVAAN
jgi:dipeptidyl aminopeptidase/acylaminoacyl peptidase